MSNKQIASQNTDTLIEVVGLNTYYGASHILRGVDFRVQRGETIGLMVATVWAKVLC